MVTYTIESKFPEEDSWHPVWIAPANRTTMEELVRTLSLYRKNNSDVLYRLIKFEVIG